MKTLIISFSILLILLFTGTAFCNIDSGLIAHYPLDGNAEDMGSNGFDGIPMDVGWSEDAVSGSALLLEGNGSFVDLEDNIKFEYNQPFSISFWIKPAGIERGIILSKQGKFRNKTGWELRFNHKNQLVMTIVTQKKHSQVLARTKNSYVDLNSYYHVVLTYDGSGIGSGIRIFVDGKNQLVHSHTARLLRSSIQTDAHMNIGAKANLSYKRQQQFKGLVDELSFYDKALSADEVKELFNAFSGGGTATDSDGDGVPDNWDQCPNTLPGLPVCSDGCASTSCAIPGDTQPPYDGAIIINNGASSTGSSLVEISISAMDDQGIIGYWISEDETPPTADEPNWTAVSPTSELSKNIAYALTPSEGSKTLFARFKDASGNVSDPAEASIFVSYFKLPDTGQKLSFTITLGEDSDYTRNAPSFSNLSSETVRDNNTKLIWQRKDDQVPRDHATATAHCEDLSLDGYSDWRLPTVKELTTILDYAEVAPAINVTHFSYTAANMGNYYWTSTAHPDDADKFFNIDFRYGTINALNSSSRANFVKCVRGNQPGYNLTDNNDGTITDNITRLVWMQGSAGPMNWESAIAYCEDLYPTNERGWRLPNFKELELLRDNTKYAPSLDTNLFLNVASHYWSSTTSVFVPTLAYVSNFSGSMVSTYSGKLASYYVKCVQKK